MAGLRLFIGKDQCINCHNGPLLTDNRFHNTGVPAVLGLPQAKGREAGARLVREDIFNCLGPYSDAEPDQCSELRFMAGPFDAPGMQDTVPPRRCEPPASLDKVR